MKIKLLLIPAFGLVALTREVALGQSSISGIVTDLNAKPLANVAIAIDGTYDGTFSNKDGSFSFQTTEKGSQVLVSKLEGYQDAVQVVDIKDANSTITCKVIFTVKALSLSNVVVRARKFENDDKIKAVTLSSTDVLTTAMDGNVVSALKTMPGAQQVGESSGLFVRGGTGDESKMFMDGLLVNNFTYSSPANQASRSRFAPGLFKGAFFSSGGYSALYGEALSAALILESQDMPANSNADFGISPLSIEGGVQILSEGKKTLVGTFAKYTDLSLVFSLVKPTIRFTTAPKYLDGSFFVKRKVGEKGFLKFYSSLGESNLRLRQSDPDYLTVNDLVGLRNTNLYTNLTYNQELPKGWKLYLGSSLNYNLDRFSLKLQPKTSPESVYDSLSRDNTSLLQFRTVLSKRVLNNGRVQWGGELFRGREGYASDRTSLGQLQDTYGAGFVELETAIVGNLSGRAGVRLEKSALLETTKLAPRTSLNYTFADKSQLMASYGTFYQKPGKYYLLTGPKLTYNRADHYILTYQKMDNYHSFRTELYYKKYNDLIKTTPHISNDGYGYARGLELFWRDKKTIRGFDYWVSYSFLDTKRNYLDYPLLAQPSFAANHTLSVVAKRYFAGPRINLSASYAFATGRPYYNPNLSDDEFMRDRTINFNNLGLSICYLPKIGNSFSVIALTFSNVLGNQQVFGYTYSRLEPTQRMPITPTNNPFVFLGLFMNFGVDRTNDIIDKNL
ncbi:TonB-dependent receptor [Hymenobacter cavernae]|uniref:TonB-dependent receptor n=1 Tax=Hymenobacter cavernae TaxID=2044852 RepID=A0ABQ1TV50_9BACT|nr:TonB-dependent receptor [Hymenobacter cavernae]GGF03843.1 TonB-dependent receptor [Hymenobacter cavernae]